MVASFYESSAKIQNHLNIHYLFYMQGLIKKFKCITLLSICVQMYPFYNLIFT